MADDALSSALKANVIMDDLLREKKSLTKVREVRTYKILTIF